MKRECPQSVAHTKTRDPNNYDQGDRNKQELPYLSNDSWYAIYSIRLGGPNCENILGYDIVSQYDEQSRGNQDRNGAEGRDFEAGQIGFRSTGPEASCAFQLQLLRYLGLERFVGGLSRSDAPFEYGYILGELRCRLTIYRIKVFGLCVNLIDSLINCCSYILYFVAERLNFWCYLAVFGIYGFVLDVSNIILKKFWIIIRYVYNTKVLIDFRNFRVNCADAISRIFFWIFSGYGCYFFISEFRNCDGRREICPICMVGNLSKRYKISVIYCLGEKYLCFRETGSRFPTAFNQEYVSILEPFPLAVRGIRGIGARYVDEALIQNICPDPSVVRNHQALSPMSRIFMP